MDPDHRPRLVYYYPRRRTAVGSREQARRRRHGPKRCVKRDMLATGQQRPESNAGRVKAQARLSPEATIKAHESSKSVQLCNLTN